MRSKRLRKRQNTFIQAKAVEKNHIPWGKYIYIAVLMVLAVTLVQWVYERAFFMKGLGFLEAETTFVAPGTIGRISDIKCTINDRVSEGQPLVVLGNTILATHVQIESGVVDFSTQRKIIDLESQTQLLSQQINQEKENINHIKDELKRAKELFDIQAITRSQYLDLKEQLNETQNNLEALKIEFVAASKKLTSYKNQFFLYSGVDTNTRPERILFAPQNGIVTNIFKQKGEIAKTGEVIIEITGKDKNYIKAYFSGVYEKALQAGDQAQIHFENGEKSSGRIHKIYPSAHSLPAEKTSKFGIEKRSLIVEILPNESTRWDRILGTEVKVLVKRKWVKDIGF